MHKTVIFCLVYSQILWEIYIWSIFKDFVHMLFLITKLKMSKFVKITQKILYFTIKPYKMYSILKIWSKYLEFRIRNFSGFSGSGFFSGYKTVRGLAGGQTIDQNAMLKFLSLSVLPVIWWQKVADMKNAKNPFYIILVNT